MKSFIQYNEHIVQTLDPAEDDNKGLLSICLAFNIIIF